jgi:hypothetical protein
MKQDGLLVAPPNHLKLQRKVKNGSGVDCPIRTGEER